MTPKLNGLRELASRAESGSWLFVESSSLNLETWANFKRYGAAANPKTVLALLEIIDLQREALESYEYVGVGMRQQKIAREALQKSNEIIKELG
jgi:hypothetical protein